MSVLEYVIGGVIILVSLIIIGVILLQQGRRAGINGAISGGADTFLRSRHCCKCYCYQRIITYPLKKFN